MDVETQLEGKSQVDNAWYECEVSIVGSELRLSFVGFEEDYEYLSSEIEIEKRLKFPSAPLQDASCNDVKLNDQILGFYRDGVGNEKYFDCTVLAVRLTFPSSQPHWFFLCIFSPFFNSIFLKFRSFF